METESTIALIPREWREGRGVGGGEGKGVGREREKGGREEGGEGRRGREVCHSTPLHIVTAYVLWLLP